ncbi:MAG TPA: SsgA family sporulation/cell division regulator [Streptomyces sp.]|nr:SsgA family sporulation/cell division regulator [Streptomyces sp.]
MPVVEQYARARIVTDTDDREERGAVRVTLRHDSEDPRNVRVGLPPGPGPREWTFARSLLEQGLRAPVRSGPVRVWPCGRVQTVVEFHSRQGCSLVQFETKALTRFLGRTRLAAAAVTEATPADPVPG